MNERTIFRVCNVKMLTSQRFIHGLVTINMALLSTLLFLSSTQAKENELVILTSFSREPLLPLIQEFSKQHRNVDIQVIHRRTQSSIQLLNKAYMKNIDLVLSSSPFLMQHLTETGKLTQLPTRLQTPNWLEPYVLPLSNKVVTVGYSGAGLIWNRDYLSLHHLPHPRSFSELTNFRYFGHITMSTPARSGTTQLMVESILSKYGWQQGWRILLNVGANLATISSRSFGVSDYVAKGQFGIGPTVDSYATILEKKLDYIRFQYDQDFTLMPTYIAQIYRPEKDQYAVAFIEFLRSNVVQAGMGNNDFAKHPLTDKSLYSDKYTHLLMPTIVGREEWVNLLFDLAITKRLPQLKDIWLALNNARTKFANDPRKLAQLDMIEKEVFTIPVTENDLLQVNQTLDTLPFDSTQDGNRAVAMTMKIAEQSHRWKKDLASILEKASTDLKQVNLGKNP